MFHINVDDLQWKTKALHPRSTIIGEMSQVSEMSTTKTPVKRARVPYNNECERGKVFIDASSELAGVA